MKSHFIKNTEDLQSKTPPCETHEEAEKLCVLYWFQVRIVQPISLSLCSVPL